MDAKFDPPTSSFSPLEVFSFLATFASGAFRSSLDGASRFVQWSVNTAGPFVSILFVIFFEFLVLGCKQIQYLLDQEHFIHYGAILAMILLTYIVFPAPISYVGSIFGAIYNGLCSALGTINPMAI